MACEFRSNVLQPQKQNLHSQISASCPGNTNTNLKDHPGNSVSVSGPGTSHLPKSVVVTQNSLVRFISSPSDLIGNEFARVIPPGILPGSTKGATTMAKRNARERNRVRQVNQGFQTLRQHIPESHRLKKMCKVDTLKCAVSYIRSLERVLNQMNDEEDHNNSSCSSGHAEQQLLMSTFGSTASDLMCSLNGSSSSSPSSDELSFTFDNSSMCDEETTTQDVKLFVVSGNDESRHSEFLENNENDFTSAPTV